MINEKINKIYRMLDRNIIKSKEYLSFIQKLVNESDKPKEGIENLSFRDLFTFDGKFDVENANKSFSNLSVMNKVSNVLNYGYEFYDIMLEANKTDNIITNICNTHFLSVMYGNPYNIDKDDFSLEDRLFYIIQIVFGMDTIVDSYYDKDAFNKRINYITKDYSNNEFYNFITVLEEIYKELKDEKDVQIIKSRVREYSDSLKPYVSAGLQGQIDEVIRSNNGSFSNISMLEQIVVDDILEYSRNKKM